jgi:tRNA threonylcarbamoyladenosine biosynthesis protein TsaE
MTKVKSQKSKSQTFNTISALQTQELGEILAKELQGGEIICLTGELGSGKTTFAQGVLKGLGARGPYTSPTFLVMKHYKKEIPNPKSQIPNKSKTQNLKIQNIYHIDAYRVGPKDILDLGWEEIVAGENNVVIVEWAERIQNIIPACAIWVNFSYLDDRRRKMVLKPQFPISNFQKISKSQ